MKIHFQVRWYTNSDLTFDNRRVNKIIPKVILTIGSRSTMKNPLKNSQNIMKCDIKSLKYYRSAVLLAIIIH